MDLVYTPEEYLAQLESQTARAATLVDGLNTESLNVQPYGGKAWSVGQCLDHLCISNETVIPAFRSAVEKNRSRLRPRTTPMRPAGFFSRSIISNMGPEKKLKFSAPSNIVPASQVGPEVLTRFGAAQSAIAEFMGQFGRFDLGRIRYRNPLVRMFHFTVDSGLLLMLNHNERHLAQAEQVKREQQPGR